MLEFHYSTLADRLRQLAFLNKGVIDHHQGRARGPEEAGDLFRQGRPDAVRAVAQPEQEAAASQADRVQRHQGRRRGRPRAAVRGRLQREHVHLREQHQHPRGRHPPHRLQVGAHPDHQRRRQAARLPEEGRLHALGRGHPRGSDLRAAREGERAAVRGADQDQAGQLRGRGHRQDGRERAPRQLPRGAPAGRAQHHREGRERGTGPRGRAQGAGPGPEEVRPRERGAPGQAGRLLARRPGSHRDLPGRGRLRRRQRQAGPRPLIPGHPPAARARSSTSSARGSTRSSATRKSGR